MKNHIILKHCKDPLLKCDKCNSRHRTEIGLRRHVEDIHGEKLYNVDQEEVDAVLEDLVHKKPGKCPGKCPFCSKYRSSLKQHIIEVHQKDKAWKCDQCNYSFDYENGLLSHKAIHEPKVDEKKLEDGIEKEEGEIDVMDTDDKKKIEKSRAEKENKVEAKTCPFCQNQVATTWMGLKRHVRKMHPEKLDIKPSRLGSKKEQKEKVIYTLC